MTIVLQIATLAATVIGFAGLMFAMWSFRKTMHAQVMMGYSERFTKLMDEFPREIFVSSQGEGNMPDSTPELTFTYIKYFNLTLEEFYLQRNGYFPKDLWQVWEADIKKFLAHPATRREWARLRDSFRDDAEFYAFVEQGQNTGDLA